MTNLPKEDKWTKEFEEERKIDKSELEKICPFCDKRFSKYKEYGQHLAEDHREEVENFHRENSEKNMTLYCGGCGEGYDSVDEAVQCDCNIFEEDKSEKGGSES